MLTTSWEGELKGCLRPECSFQEWVTFLYRSYRDYMSVISNPMSGL